MREIIARRDRAKQKPLSLNDRRKQFGSTLCG
jgi:hypothetical protein